ncbi:HEXXH motif-containing putative peptide modification protein [Nocardia vulneris]|uniref:aKG-HExxH-type peptide beta-hydroxylase n=1 Tax=Nocardia vulneris TaxID=1141657 RepID=UPI0030CE6492
MASFYQTPDIQIEDLAMVFARYNAVIARELDTVENLSAEIQAARTMPPEAYWVALAVMPKGKPAESEVAAVRNGLRRARRRTSRGPEIVAVDNASMEDRHALGVISANVYGGESEAAATLARDAGTYRENIAIALRRLQLCWPEAAVEVAVLIDRILLLENTELSASHDQLFGIVFVGTEWVSNAVRAMQVLLHECGHHSMFLRTAHVTYLANPEEMTTHPLRPDPRPMFGTLHAAFVLWRMRQGLVRWVEYSGAQRDSEEYQLMCSNGENLAACLEVLDAKAEWTEEGRSLYSNLRTGFELLATP